MYLSNIKKKNCCSWGHLPVMLAHTHKKCSYNQISFHYLQFNAGQKFEKYWRSANSGTRRCRLVKTIRQFRNPRGHEVDGQVSRDLSPIETWWQHPVPGEEETPPSSNSSTPGISTDLSGVGSIDILESVLLEAGGTIWGWDLLEIQIS